jgi:thiamine pyrophosphate-dependent acetolactate synthase large subunit-like protein
MRVVGYQVLARTLQEQGFDTLFYLMGGPMLSAERAWIDAGMRAIDVRHEESAAMMAHAYARVARRPGLCMAASGPGTANLVAGMANALVDGAPVLAVGGSAAISDRGRGGFQEIDQVAMMRPVTKWAEQVHDSRRVPEFVATALRHATSGAPGPVYLDMPADVLYQSVEEADVRWTAESPLLPRVRPHADAATVDAAVRLLASSQRPIVVSGSGVLWSDAARQLQRFIEVTGVPLFTTPQGRGALAEDHPLCPIFARSVAFGEADLIMVVGTRLNWVIGHGQPPRFRGDARMIQVDIDPAEIGHNRPADVALCGDAAAVLEQLTAASARIVNASRYAPWVEHLHQVHVSKAAQQEAAMSTVGTPIHPLRLCREVRDVLQRDAVLVVDGHEILNFARQSIPTFTLGHRLNSGPFGHMGIGLPYALGARAAKPAAQVVALVGDGSLGMSAMELDTAARHRLDVIVVVSNNGGWTSATLDKPGRDLGFTRFDLVAQALGCHGECVERPEEIAPALQRALGSGRPALVNVATDPAAHSQTVSFAKYEAMA